MKTTSYLSLILLPVTHGWLEKKNVLPSHRRSIVSPGLVLFAGADAKTETENPCWQDIYDEDCGMDSVYAASFIAKEWIKSMPCAEGVEVGETRR